MRKITENGDLPSGKRLHNYGRINHVDWEISLFLWPFSSSLCNKLPEGIENTLPLYFIFLRAHLRHNIVPLMAGDGRRLVANAKMEELM